LPEFLQLVARTAGARGWRVAIHAAESALEFEMFAHKAGEMFDWLKRSGRDMSDCGLGSPVQHIERCGLLRANLLLAHVNYLSPGDAQLLARRKAHVVHCPRCHAYFRHEAFCVPELIKAGVNVCLGTDSLASTYKRQRQTVELNLFEEMRALALKSPGLRPLQILEMATINGARALGMIGRVGELAPGAHADLIAVPCSGGHSKAYEEVIEHQGNVSASLIDGRWAWGRQETPRIAPNPTPRRPDRRASA
jgi:cytosine/adenosine deaminase-related metal-dependent hydrolase